MKHSLAKYPTRLEVEQMGSYPNFAQLCAVAVVVLLLAKQCPADETQAMIKEARRSWEFIDTSVTSLSYTVAVATRTTYTTPKDKGRIVSKPISHFECAILNRCRRVTGRFPVYSTNSTTAVVQNNHYSFIATTADPSRTDLWQLLRNTEVDGVSSSGDWFISCRELLSPATSILTDVPHSLTEIVDHSSTRLVTSRGDRSIVRISGQTELSSEMFKHTTGITKLVIDVDSSQSWRVLSFRTEVRTQLPATDSVVIDGVVKYAQDNIQYPNQVAVMEVNITSPSGSVQKLYEFNYSAGSGDRESNYFLTHYGLPEPPGITPPAQLTPTYVWLLLATGGLAVISVGSRWLLKRRTNVAPTSSTV